MSETPFGTSAMAAFSLAGPRPTRPRVPAVEPEATEARVAGIEAVLDPTGALYWPAENLLVVSDLHLETGSSYARTGQMLPPYDTRETLARLSRAITRHRPARVLSLGDSFHDRGGVERMTPEDRAMVDRLTGGAEFIWVTGNHEGDCARMLAGTVCDEITMGGVAFRHIPSPDIAGREVAGHLHPAARIILRGRTLRRRCFIACERRVVMPAFGCLTGGLSVADPAFAPLWPATTPKLYFCGRERVYAV
ncbi:ligase-associated DNA damage response endonuclease PdeM [Acuticoccus sp.]|uniref:ligase-associated DNA damage response endonuclease PdeM n=1 Tax=Acuticoccus sp. TaxID=1904378 RepID=UPI003B517898